MEEANMSNKEPVIGTDEVETFLRTVAHDIRNSMAIIQGYTEFILRESDNPKVHEHAQGILQNTKTLQETLEIIQTFRDSL